MPANVADSVCDEYRNCGPAISDRKLSRYPARSVSRREADPNSAGVFRSAIWRFAERNLTIDRLEDRRKLLASPFRHATPRCGRSYGHDRRDGPFRSARRSIMVTGDQAARARRSTSAREDRQTARSSYGRNTWGQSTLLAQAVGRGGRRRLFPATSAGGTVTGTIEGTHTNAHLPRDRSRRSATLIRRPRPIVESATNRCWSW